MIFLSCNKKSHLDKNIISQKDSLPVYLSLANDINLSYDFKQKYAQKAFSIIVDEKNDSVNRINLFKVANRYYNMNDLKSYKTISQLILERSMSAKDSSSIAKAYTYLGDYYGAQLVSDSAFRNYFKAQKIYLQINDKYNLSKTLLSKASLQYNEGDFFESEISVFKALSILKEQKDVNDLLYECYNLLGILNNEKEEYSKALEFQNKALNTLTDKTIPLDLQLKATSFNNIGFVYMRMKDYKQAIPYFQKGLQEKNLFEEKTILYAMLLDNLAYSKLKSRNMEGLPDLFYRSMKIRDSLGMRMAKISNQIHLSEYYAFKKDTFKAIQLSKQALLLSRSSDKLNNTLQALKQIAVVDPKNAAKYSREYILLNDKMLKAERNMGEKFSRIEYETNEIKDQNSSLQEKNKTLIYVFSICTLIGLFFYVYKTQQAKNRELLFKQQQQIANEDIYNLMISQQNEIELTRIKEKKKVAQELHDGVLGRMFGVRISLDSLDKIDEAEAAEKRRKYLAELKHIEEDIREISHDLNREKSELINNFVVILNKLFDNQKNTYPSKLETSFDSHIKWELVNNIVKINLYRIIQEALQNCNKYAKADTIKVEFKSEIDHLVLSIFDDGVGFNVRRTKNGIGLHNIEYRAAECKGTAAIKSAKGEGTLLVVKVPIDQKINLQKNDI
ncbi:tetratricopeptide repeat-containing sensor histidine kinase [Flavobacterium johnsoniae]|jgi:signal transduction histidine kinase|uniref:histidine kinase n=1 Tax=Flavobacterium johnsoniae (strain ATCC 17061 / DSM 2064 / JCM 8514 / BCRC 14874 / CCUG 350202 / NBRC 14942 / NCIMB 11054 / UW101) TaxID=376686 RepID=A5FLT9_FLAJ1|nr:ATP-binding protein [Flavobacterium johnsoniae]ABQ03827.1 histidine kinase [Flavobacterium johnsoniae UW101]OXG03344.1 sensor histidine kinase [Flavobacterium johnsoniae UW101]WQG79308.1 histidine kinase [Flavobacterium johnsoniae UW101]SHK03953.1 Signal transduction histidine kinase [Flavobacterium johnsoniae]